MQNSDRPGDRNCEKTSIRKKILSLRNRLEPWEREAEEICIYEEVLRDPEYRARKNVFIYVAYRSEASTDRLIREAFSDGHRVYVPKVIDGENSCMEFFRIESMDALENGYRGIPEPCGNETYEGPYDDVYMVLPGAVYDMKGGRIGYGCGFYDRYLKGKEDIYRAGVCFSCQVVENVPSEPCDVRVDRVICGAAVPG